MFRAPGFETVAWYVDQDAGGEAGTKPGAPRAVFCVRYPLDSETVKHEFTGAELADEIERFRKCGWGIPGQMFDALDDLTG